MLCNLRFHNFVLSTCPEFGIKFAFTMIVGLALLLILTRLSASNWTSIAAEPSGRWSYYCRINFNWNLMKYCQFIIPDETIKGPTEPENTHTGLSASIWTSIATELSDRRSYYCRINLNWNLMKLLVDVEIIVKFLRNFHENRRDRIQLPVDVEIFSNFSKFSWKFWKNSTMISTSTSSWIRSRLSVNLWFQMKP